MVCSATQYYAIIAIADYMCGQVTDLEARPGPRMGKTLRCRLQVCMQTNHIILCMHRPCIPASIIISIVPQGYERLGLFQIGHCFHWTAFSVSTYSALCYGQTKAGTTSLYRHWSSSCGSWRCGAEGHLGDSVIPLCAFHAPFSYINYLS